MNGVSSVGHCTNAAIRINETVFAFDHIAISGFHVRFLVTSGGITHAIIEMEIGVVTVVTYNQRSSIGARAGHNQSGGDV